jgi:hypothetical protein
MENHCRQIFNGCGDTCQYFGQHLSAGYERSEVLENGKPVTESKGIQVSVKKELYIA